MVQEAPATARLALVFNANAIVAKRGPANELASVAALVSSLGSARDALYFSMLLAKPALSLSALAIPSNVILARHYFTIIQMQIKKSRMVKSPSSTRACPVPG